MLSNIILYQPNKPNKKISLCPVDEAVPADNDDEMAYVAPVDVALSSQPAHNNVGASLVERNALNSVGLNATDDADGTLEDDSLASDDVEFAVSVRIHLYYEFTIIRISLICEFTYIIRRDNWTETWVW